MKNRNNSFILGITGILIFIYLISCAGVTDSDKADSKDVPMPVTDKFEPKPFAYDSSKKYIYLTFDDGPQHGTVTCFQLCKDEKIKSSFFMVGQHSLQKSDGKKIVSMIREGYPQALLANHSFTHANGKYVYFYQHPQMAGDDFFRAQETLNVPYKIIRLPGNRSWVRQGEIKATNLVRSVAELLDSAGYNVIGWDVEWHFNHKNARPVQSPAKLAAEVDSAFARNDTHSPNHLVILTHDRMFQRPGDADSLAKFIKILKQNPQYVFETVDHYPGLKKLR